ncbi:DeoR/GlpR family transcriptional regulator of sugar metabolism [Evansella vedderi]|uniref:DeoR/GlpR family transcriptional regulator of sugar metabolism n=1 Tax=Evansella vedderi TaxID=38282 RepID=A0ABU0A1A5_9BACI|nr:DeoR/GlpR family DNA-binding transcription regulator [Evansella vedderi]MDQ0257030.1 DeoR/GlpR family transcriptional regulator of sugar metabolism [Evansella vedderi]
MLAEERYKKIVALVNERGSIRVSELSQIFGVTEETIRRDLGKLEGEGKLTRSHGGAVSVESNQSEIPYATREVINVEEKKTIALEAISHIQEEERVFLDASTTAWYVASSLPNMPLTVLTNSMKVALELSEKDKIHVICLGGSLTTISLSFVGPLAESALDQYFIDKAFISSKGIDVKRGLSDNNELQARLRHKVIELSDKVYYMADYSKFGTRALTKISDVTSIDSIITDTFTEEAIVQGLRDSGVKVIIAT